MIEIIPAINVKTFEDVKKQVETIESLGLTWAQLDIHDGEFTDIVGFNQPEKLPELSTHLKFEAHLMIYEPEYELDKWIRSGVKRIIFHYEASHKREDIIKKLIGAGIEAGIALKPITPWQFIEKLLPSLDLIQILGVNPGPSGQEFQGEEIVHKIETLRKAHPDITIEIDGGVSDKNAKMLVEAGADILAVGSYLFESEDPKEALEKLQAALSGHE